MVFRKSALARLGATALLVAGALTAVGAPARAAGDHADLELSVAGLKLAAGAQTKIGFAKVTNRGPGVPSAMSISADLSAVDVEHQGVAVPFSDECELDDAAVTITCTIPSEAIPGVGQTLDVPVFVVKAPTATTPYRAPVTFTVTTPGEIDPSDNTRTVELVLSDEQGVDLGVHVPDVAEKLVAFEEPGGALRPGDTTAVVGLLFNWGDATAVGLKVTVQLPEQVTFAEPEPDCAYSADNRKADCHYGTVVLRPTGSELESDDEIVPVFWWPVVVGAGVRAPVTLAEGSVTVEAVKQLGSDQTSPRISPQTLPKNVKMVTPDSVDAHEVDASDNTDDFAVVVAAGGPGGGDQDGDGGAGGGLPVTGAQAGLVGGIGFAVLLAGGVLVLLARRRRVVLVAPADEKTNN